MQKEMKKASVGHRQSMEQLYNETKNHVSYLIYCILLDEKQTENAMVFIYESLWRDGHLNKMSTKEELIEYLEQKVARYCRNLILKKNKKALNVPHQKNFYIGGLLESIHKQGEVTTEVLKQLPILQRFILVLHTVGNCTDDEMAKVLNWKPQVLQLALESEERNVDKILSLLNRKEINPGEWVQILKDGIAEMGISEQTEHKIFTGINNIATPIEKKKKQRMILVSALSVLIIASIGFAAYQMTRTLKESEKTSSEKKGTESEAEETETTEEDTDVVGEIAYADIAIEGYGTISVQLDETAAPETVANFVNLAEEGFYDGLTFHRIIEDFMMQGGDPNGDGTGGSEETITGEFSENGFENNLSHTRGAVSMARSDDYDSASSQFFIVHEDSTHLDGSYAVFGYVTEGMDIVDEICESAEPTDDNGTIPSEEQPVITSITIRREEA